MSYPALPTEPTADNNGTGCPDQSADPQNTDLPLIQITPAHCFAEEPKKKKRKRKSPPCQKFHLPTKQRRLEEFCFMRYREFSVLNSSASDETEKSMNLSVTNTSPTVNNQILPAENHMPVNSSTPKPTCVTMATETTGLTFEQSVHKNFEGIRLLIEKSISTTKEVKSDLNSFKVEVKEAHEMLEKNVNGRIDALQRELEEFKVDANIKFSACNGGQDIQIPEF